MKFCRKACTLLLAALLCIPAGCASPQASGAGPSPAVPAYEADPIAWLERKTGGDGAAHEKLSKEEIRQLTALAAGAESAKCFFHAEELTREDLMWVLYFYYQDITLYDAATGKDTIRPDLRYPPDGEKELSGDWRVYLSAEKADALIRDMLGTSIPDNALDYGDPRDDSCDVVCKDGAYYICAGDSISYELHLGAYQYLGDGIFYLSFDGDDSYMPGPEEAHMGIIPDHYRLLAVRSDSAWGFTVKANLKRGEESLLSADFPLPLYAA